MLSNPPQARAILLDCRNALVSARTKLRVASTVADLDHTAAHRCPERLAVATALLLTEKAVSELSHALSLVTADVARRAPSEAQK